MVLNQIRSANVKFREQYGRIVLACDGKASWRKDLYPFYKSHRKGDRDKQTDIDWKAAFSVFDSLKEELLAYTDWLVLEIDKAEGDDVIGVLARTFDRDPNIIISLDKDFRQLQAFTQVKQYDPVKKEFIRTTEPAKYLYDHILHGDKGDFIPNILTDYQDYFDGKRQKALTEKRYQELIKTSVDSWSNPLYTKNWYRNKTLIDLRETPQEIQDNILTLYASQKDRSGKKLYDYFFKYKLVKFMEQRQDFN